MNIFASKHLLCCWGKPVAWRYSAISQNSHSESKQHVKKTASRALQKARSLHSTLSIQNSGVDRYLNYCRDKRGLRSHKKYKQFCFLFSLKNVISTSLTCILNGTSFVLLYLQIFATVILQIVYKYVPSSFKADTSLNHACTC